MIDDTIYLNKIKENSMYNDTLTPVADGTIVDSNLMYIYTMLGLVVSLFAPVAGFILILMGVVALDTGFGIAAALRQGRKFKSSKTFTGFLLKLLIYPWAILGIYYLDILVLEGFVEELWKEFENPGLKVAVLLAIGHEITSINEHTEVLWKSSLFDKINVVINLFTRSKKKLNTLKEKLKNEEE